MRQRLNDAETKKLYHKRAGIVEPVFGMIKETLGYRRFLLRGLQKVRGEWAVNQGGGIFFQVQSCQTRENRKGDRPLSEARMHAVDHALQMWLSRG